MEVTRATETDPEPAAVVATPAESSRLTIRLPESMPLAVRLGEFALGAMAAGIGILIGLVAAAGIHAPAARGNAWARLFVLDGAQALLPVAIVCMFCWGLAICGLRSAQLTGLSKLSSRTALNDLTRAASDPSVTLKALGGALSGPIASASPLHRRAHAVVQQWQLHAELSAALALVDQHAVVDEDGVRRGYGTVRTFVWALPVLGLIGTVFGIASAVGDFSTFLGAKAEDVAAIKQALVSVTGGLAFAFGVTILGLVASLLLMLPAAALQAKEERFFGSLHSMISEVFLPTLQRRFPVQATAVEPVQGFRETMLEVGEGLIRSMGVAVAQTGKAVVGSLGSSLEPSLASNERIIAALSEELRIMREAAHAALQAHEGALDRHSSSLATIRDGLASAIDGQAAAVAAIADQVSRLAETTLRTLEAQRTVADGLAALAPLPSAMGAAASAMSKLSQMQSGSEAATQSLVLGTERLLAGQQALNAAMSQLDAMGLSRTLPVLAQSLETVSAILAAFQEPMVLQAVPARVANASNPQPRGQHPSQP